MAYAPLTRGMTNEDLANRALKNPEATAMELALANKLLDAERDIQKLLDNQCKCD